jgi:hypothetical protein
MRKTLLFINNIEKGENVAGCSGLILTSKEILSAGFLNMFMVKKCKIAYDNESCFLIPLI